MRTKKPRVVSLDEIKITRRGDTAELAYADDAMGGLVLKLGVDVGGMSDHDLLERHNESVRAMEALAASHDHVAIEVPVGSPQLRYVALSDQWVPRGAVVRGRIHDGGVNGETTIEVDDRELSLRELGRMLSTYAGWGLRLVFVPDDEIQETPVIEVREPDDDAGRDAAPMAAVASPTATPRTAGGPTAVPTPSRDMITQRAPIYQLRITLKDTDPLVWRRVLLSGNVTLKRVHQVIQAAMGWTDTHLHVFVGPDGHDVVSDARVEIEEARDEAKVKLRSFARVVGDRFRYEYDLGDCWRHNVEVEAILSPAAGGRTPRCVDGGRACPPEDCGGVPRYAELVAAMRDPKHPERALFRRWLGGDFDPEAFDVADANRRLGRLR